MGWFSSPVFLLTNSMVFFNEQAPLIFILLLPLCTLNPSLIYPPPLQRLVLSTIVCECLSLTPLYPTFPFYPPPPHYLVSIQRLFLKPPWTTTTPPPPVWNASLFLCHSNPSLSLPSLCVVVVLLLLASEHHLERRLPLLLCECPSLNAILTSLLFVLPPPLLKGLW